MEIFYFLGFAVGFLVGLTGMGGGAVLTPALIFLGVQPRIAVGTDLLYSAVTRFLASLMHYRKGNVNVKVSSTLLAGSIPGLLISAYFMTFLRNSWGVEVLNRFLTQILAFVLIISSLATIYKMYFLKSADKTPDNLSLILTGFVVGALVQLTSVGSGVLVTLFLLLFTGMVSRVIVGTELLFGFVLTFFASIIHAGMGNVDYGLALMLTVSSIPGVVAGVFTSSKIDDRMLRVALSALILVMGVVLLLG
ncbi:sulfite exporter TauE/SafE family protein [Geoglobus acetivorans]|uniref:Probable membrane transporter protein n=1 Tax=Geoglobus acetivorans TaxID=565033 RepID=A0A0A7GGW1_GEOAI|nr:membrane protein, putative [Geoglobus acetivorans]